MLLEHLSNSSPVPGFVGENFDYIRCEDFVGLKYIWAFGTAVCFALGFPASVAILWEMFKTHRRGTPFSPNYFFILNLSVMDVVFLAFIPPGLLNHFIWEKWLVEQTWNGIYALNICGRPLLMACACVDCYLAVVHPITYRKRKSLTPRVVVAGVVWALTVACGIAYFMFFSLYLTAFPTVPFIAAIVTIAVCDSFIFHALIKSDPSKKNIHPQKQRAIQTLINSLVLALISYLPPVLLFIIGLPVIGNSNTFVCTIAIPVNMTSTLGSMVMPLLYLNNLGKLDRFRVGCCRKT